MYVTYSNLNPETIILLLLLTDILTISVSSLLPMNFSANLFMCMMVLPSQISDVSLVQIHV